MSMINHINQIIGTRLINIHQPDLPISCNLLTDIEIEGKNINKLYAIDSIQPVLIRESTKPIKKLIKMFIKTNIQYSFLVALQSKSTYFFIAFK